MIRYCAVNQSNPVGHSCVCRYGFVPYAPPVTTACRASPAPTPTPTATPPSFVPTSGPTLPAPTAPPPSFVPTSGPTLHCCADGNHGCDGATTYCVTDPTDTRGYHCACRSGFVHYTPPVPSACRSPSTSPAPTSALGSSGTSTTSESKGIGTTELIIVAAVVLLLVAGIVIMAVSVARKNKSPAATEGQRVEPLGFSNPACVIFKHPPPISL